MIRQIVGDQPIRGREPAAPGQEMLDIAFVGPVGVRRSGGLEEFQDLGVASAF